MYTTILSGTKRVVGYYPAWNRYTFPADKIEYEHLTHITHAFIWPKSDGKLDKYSTIPYPDLVDMTHQAGKKILISVGGWGNCTYFSAILSDSIKRLNFIQNLVSFCNENGYDGVDLDWEYPGNSDKSNLTRFVIDLNQALKAANSSRIVTMAVPAGAWSGQYYDFSAMMDYVEWFGCMTYDFHGTWTSHAGHNAPLYAPSNEFDGSAHEAIQYLKSRGLPGKKILMGIPFYGRRFTTAGLYQSCTGGEGLNYSEIISKIDNGWIYHWDSVAKVPYLTNTDNSQLITFDDTASVRNKCEYVLAQELSGVKIWHIGQDQIDDEQPLLTLIGTKLLSVSSNSNEILSNAILPEKINIIGVFPNPFNCDVKIRYKISEPMNVRIDLLNLLGRKIVCLKEGYHISGNHYLNYRPVNLTSGCYFIVFSNENGFNCASKVIYLK